jgi:dienelactone hydrolase
MGQDDFTRGQAKKLAEAGYVGIALDIYGDGTVAKSPEEAKQLMTPYYLDRPLLQQRMLAGFEAALKLPYVDKSKMGAIGFCFGGLSVIELLRSRAPVRGVVSLHGAISSKEAKLGIKTGPINGALLVLHGNLDPLVSWEDIHSLAEEMTEAGADWEFDIYGHTMHAFTNPNAHDKNSGLVYNKKANDRAFQRMKLFFQEIFA